MGKMNDDLKIKNAVIETAVCLSSNIDAISNLQLRIQSVKLLVEKQNAITKSMTKRVLTILEENNGNICEELTEAQRTKRRQMKASVILEKLLTEMQFKLDVEIDETLVRMKGNVDFINRKWY